MSQNFLNPSTASGCESCPGRGTLEAFSLGRLSEDELLAIADHLARCDDCCGAMRGFSLGLPYARRGLAESPFADESAQRQMLTAAKQACCSPQPLGGREPPIEPQTASQEVDESRSTNSQLDATIGSFSSAPGGGSRRRSHPARIGRYEIGLVLGEGSFGTVLRGFDRELRRAVAIKLPRLSAGRDARASFLREARAAAQLRHPGIITIYDVGYAEDNAIFIAMECVDGASLQQLLARERPSLDRTVEIVAQVAEAIHFAHKKGLVHRDLKPANILIDREGQVRVADFGLALTEREQRERAGELAGSPGYMAPEQVRGEVHQLDGRTDIWSLGVILYRMLTGNRPFQGEGRQLLNAIVSQPPAAPRSYDDKIPPAVEQICLKCLEKSIARRYASAGELASELRRWRNAPSPPSGRRLWRLGAKPRAVGAAIVCSIAALAAYYLPARFEPRPPSRSAARRANAPAASAGLQTAIGLRSLITPTPEDLFPSSHPLERWSYNDKNRDLEMSNKSCGFLALGATESEQFALSVTLSKSALAGSGGLFFGFAPAGLQDGLETWNCQTICLTGTGDNRLRLDWHQLVLQTLPGNTFSVYRNKSIRQAPLANKNFLRSATLQLTVRPDRLEGISLDGERLPDLRNSAPADALSPCAGKFGIANFFGATIFHDVEFKNLGSSD